jgi:hypothetical protein
VAARIEGCSVGLAEGLRRLPERWVLAVAARRPLALLLILFGIGLACWGFSAIADVNAGSEMAGIFMVFVVFSGIGQDGFRRRLKALDDERDEVITGVPRKESSTNDAAREEESRSRPKRPSRNPRSAAFLGASNTGAHLAKEVTVLLLWSVVIFFCSRSSSVDWFGRFGLAPQLFTVAVAAALAFERVGYHQVVSRRAEEIARLRRELTRALRVPT